MYVNYFKRTEVILHVTDNGWMQSGKILYTVSNVLYPWSYVLYIFVYLLSIMAPIMLYFMTSMMEFPTKHANRS